MIETHVLLMAWYAALTASFFSLLWRDTFRERARLFAILFLALLAGGILIATLMHRYAPGL